MSRLFNNSPMFLALLPERLERIPAWKNPLRQGCRNRAYRDVFTACFSRQVFFPTASLVISALSVFPSVNYASETESQDTLLDEVVVSGSKEGTAIRETPASINKINEAAIEEKKPTFVGQVLNQAPGVYVTDLGNEQHSMAIRQPLSYNALYLYMEDGIPIRPVGLFNHNSLYEVNLMGVGDIEVIKGPASSLYGSNAVGGAVNFFTRAASSEPEVVLGLQASDQGYRRLDFDASTSFGEQGIRVAGYSFERDGGWQMHNDADKDAFTVRHDIGLDEVSALKTILTHNKLYTDMPGSLNQSDYYNRPDYSYNTFTWREVEATRFSSALEGNWNANGLTTTTLYVRDNTTDQLPSYLIFNTGANSVVGRTTSVAFTSVGLDLRHRQDLNDDLRLIVGTTNENTPMDGDEVNLSIVRDPATSIYTSYTPTTVRRDYEVGVTNHALYTQLEYGVTDAVQLVAGGRYDYIQYDYYNFLTPSNQTGAPSEVSSYNQLSPRLGASWNLSDSLNLYGNLSQGFTPPEVSAQYGGSQTAPDLSEATFTNVDTGVRWASPEEWFVADVAIYQLAGEDEIISYNIAPGQSEPRNAGETMHRGIEFGFYVQPQSFWDAKLNGAYSRHTYEDYQTSATAVYDDNEIKAAPNWLVNGELGYKPMQDVRLSAEAQYVGRYYMNDANTVEYPGHTVYNLRANYQLEEWELWASVINLSDKHYAEVAASSYSGTGAYDADAQDTYTPGAPRTFLMGVRYHFGI